ncbi:MAG: lipid-A-disaccharide synthase [Candidatus Lernaella stagnicola]|nr:lipid-A-disaccharide synthase [Candidatus Lernaella stagnicola]
MVERIAEIDRYLFCLINSGWSNPALDTIFGVLTNLGDGLVLPIFGALGLYAFDRKNWPKNFLTLGIVVLLGGLWVQIVKELVMRPRPMNEPWFGIDAAEAIKTQVVWFLNKNIYALHSPDPNLSDFRFLHVIGAQLGSRSYPSGHSAAVFGVATAISYAYRRWTYLLFIPAAFIAISRIYVGVHFPVDVTVGAAIGVINSWALLDWLKPYTGFGLVRPKNWAPSSSPPDEPLIMIVAGEASADTYAARLIRAIREKTPGAKFVGVGGEQAVGAGLTALGKAEEIAIVGFTGVVSGLFALRRVYRALLKAMDERRPDVLVCLDLPDFNLALANQAKGRGIPVVYYISPQVWAWRTGRIVTIADRIDHMVVALPFERELYEKQDVASSFFGHPIMETIAASAPERAATRNQLGLDPERPVLVLAPGSRKNEILHLAPVLAETAALVRDGNPDVQFVVPLAPTVAEQDVRPYFSRYDVEAKYLRDDFFTLLAVADAGVITSGTATLEAALARLPHVVVYRGNRLNFALARRLVKTDKIGLPNIVLDRIAFRELIQEDCTPEIVAAEAQDLLRDGPARDAALEACDQVRAALTRGEVSAHVADVVLDFVTRRHSQKAVNG